MDVNDIGKAANGQHIYRHMAPHVHALVHLLLGIGPDVQACQEQKDECQGQSGHRARLQDRGWCPSTISLHKDTPILGIALAKDQLISDNIKLRLPRCHGTASRTQQYACRRLAAGQTAPCYAPECEQEADQHLRSGPHCQKAAYVRQPRRRRSLPDSSGCQAKACTVLCPGTAGCWLLSAGGQVHLRGALSPAVGGSLTGRQAHLPLSPALSPAWTLLQQLAHVQCPIAQCDACKRESAGGFTWLLYLSLAAISGFRDGPRCPPSVASSS